MDFCREQSDCTNSSENSPQMKPCHIFGVCKGVRNNLLFPDKQTVIFPCGSHCVRYNIHQQWTQFIYSVKGFKGVQALALSPDRRYLAVSERGKWGTITIIDLQDMTSCKSQVLKGSDYGVHEFVCMAFSADSKYLLAQAGGPTWTLFYWKWEEKELVASVKSTRTGQISQVSFNPQDNTEICVSGRGVFRIFEMKGGELTRASSYKMEKEDVLCHVWMSEDCIILGTETGKLLMLKSRHMHKLKSPYVRQTETRDGSSSLTQLGSVTAITRYSKGFVCSAGPGLVCLYEETKQKDNYRKTTEIRIPTDPNSSQPLQSVATMCISPEEETLAISTDQGQLYRISLTLSKIFESKDAQFRYLSHSLHSESVTGLSVCVSKPLVATCSKDCTMRIWNYKNKSLVQFREFDEEPLSVSMHPNGHSILVGLSTEVCLMKILHDNIETVQKFYISSCTQCVFNHDGNRFAAVRKNVIHIYNVRTHETLELNDHRKNVKSVMWSSDDCRLVSCGLDGTVCGWNALTGALESKHTTDCSFRDVTFLPNTKSILALDCLSLQEIHEKRSQWEMAKDGVSYTAMCMTRSGQKIFVGTNAGTIRVIKYPFGKGRPVTEHPAHSGPITKMVVTPCDRFLLTASSDGSFLIWAITDQQGRPQDMVNEIDYAEEVLCTTVYLEEKDQTITELKSQVEWLKVEQEHNQNVKDVECYEKTNNITQNYIQQLEALKNQIQELNKEKKEQNVSHQQALTELKEKHAKKLEDLERRHVDSITGSYEKHQELYEKMQTMQQEHERTLQEVEDSQLRAMQDMKQGYEDTLQKLQAELEEEVKNSEEKQKQLKHGAESELMDLCRDYEYDLREEKETKLKIQNEMKVVEKNILQHFIVKKEMKNLGLKICKLEEKVQNLRDQLKDANERIKDMTTEKEEQNKKICDQEHNIKELHETIKSLETNCSEKNEELSAMLMEKKRSQEESNLKSSKERSEIERLEREVAENKEAFNSIGAELDIKLTKYEKIIAEQKLMMKAKDQTLITERQRIIDLNNMVQRMKGSIHNCAYFIHSPKNLKENVIGLHNRYVHEPDVTIEVEAEVIQEHTKHMDLYHSILDTEKRRRAKEVKSEKDRYIRIMRENSYLIRELNELRLTNKELVASLKEKNVQRVSTSAPSAKLHGRPQSVSQLQHSVTQRQKRNSPGCVNLPPINTTPIRRPDV